MRVLFLQMNLLLFRKLQGLVLQDLIDEIGIEFRYFKIAVKEFGMLTSPFGKHKDFKGDLYRIARNIADSANDVRQRKIWWK